MIIVKSLKFQNAYICVEKGERDRLQQLIFPIESGLRLRFRLQGCGSFLKLKWSLYSVHEVENVIKNGGIVLDMDQQFKKLQVWHQKFL